MTNPPAPPAVAQAEPTRFTPPPNVELLPFTVEENRVYGHDVAIEEVWLYADCRDAKAAQRVCAALNAVAASPAQNDVTRKALQDAFQDGAEFDFSTAISPVTARIAAREAEAKRRYPLSRTPAPRDAQSDAMQDTGEKK